MSGRFQQRLSPKDLVHFLFTLLRHPPSNLYLSSYTSPLLTPNCSITSPYLSPPTLIIHPIPLTNTRPCRKTTAGARTMEERPQSRTDLAPAPGAWLTAGGGGRGRRRKRVCEGKKRGGRARGM